MTANDYLVGLHWHDVIVIGAGHNGLVAALLFAKKGLKVLVVEEKDALGGASCTERPFANAPDLGA
jgi:ribulose 1,5-bisphosphate synthetase/thiazole synthase